MELRQRALAALCCADPRTKAALATELHGQARQCIIAPRAPQPDQPLPGRPERPELIHPARVPRRSPAKPEGLAALLHAIAHMATCARARCGPWEAVTGTCTSAA